MFPRRFALVRHVDYTGVSGIGVVAYGVVFSDGQVALRWCSTHPATSLWETLDDMLSIHGHGEATSVQWIDQVTELGDDDAARPPARGRRARRSSSTEVPPRETGFSAPPPPRRAEPDTEPVTQPEAPAERPPIPRVGSDVASPSAPVPTPPATASAEPPVPAQRKAGRHRRSAPVEIDGIAALSKTANERV